ncbi:Monoterpene epsilon-lactone hydrolase [Acaryochloris thomasi RCC1774]|uniref:Monoterpene epsilon-lactone hydrolase n=1 Tax=Acaryochloris thomasi RCC1774 TaxID=1764569 RepID=A0A2W1JEF2_9CYAN|nr:alpha/beta hydrolase [Acaryochloris thomasi]PZD72058.1 Monoterpene epsilon-lactone hydrolase [Acaryochloris thomasi RCC1774]
MSQNELNNILSMLQDFSWGDTLAEMRANFNRCFSLPSHPTAQVQTLDADGVPAELITLPNSDPDRVILYLHGGGFVMGTRQTYRRIASDLAEASSARVLVIDYRLAPEHPYPAALEDTLTAYRWLVETRRFHPSQVAIAGDSAGGNLALAALLSLRDTKEILPSSGLLISPYCDLTQTSSTIDTHGHLDLMVSRTLMDTLTAWYAPHENVKDPLISPIYADLSGLPPLLIHVGAAEILLGDALRLAHQAALANVAVELKVWQDMIHCFQLFAPMLEEGRVAISEAGAFLQHHWSPKNRYEQETDRTMLASLSQSPASRYRTGRSLPR